MNTLAKLFLTITAFAPVLLVYSIAFAMSENFYLGAAFFAVCMLLVSVCVLLIRRAKKTLASRSYTTQTVETADNEIFTFLLIYLLPLVTKDIQAYNWYLWLVVVGSFCIVVAVSYGFHFNPLLSVLGYHFYKVTRKGELTHILVTNRRLYRVGETLSVVRISEYVLIEKD